MEKKAWKRRKLFSSRTEYALDSGKLCDNYSEETSQNLVKGLELFLFW